VRLAPSILSADFAHLGAEVARVASEADLLHVDVMDGHFVPNLTIGPPVVASLRRVTDLFLDCHLMCTDPIRLLPAFAAAGADSCSVHVEIFPDPTDVIDMLRREGLGAGLVLNPGTPFAAVQRYVERVDLLLVMSVHPGFGGQAFIPESLATVREARAHIDREGLRTALEIDGGINAATIGAAAEAGADTFVAGSAIFHAPDPLAAARALRAAAAAATPVASLPGEA